VIFGLFSEELKPYTLAMTLGPLFHASTLFLFLVLVCVGCDKNHEPEKAAELWERIHAEKYQDFARAPGYETRQPSNTSHSDFSEIFINQILVDALASETALEIWPEGSLIVKDGYNSSGEHSLIAVMEKQDGEWFFAEYLDLPSSEAKFSGRPAVCVDCHALGSDSVHAFPLPQ